MDQQSTTPANPRSLEQLRSRVQHLRADANDALHAARHDYEQVRDAVRKLRERSELKAFVQTHFGSANGHGEAPARPRRKKATDTPAAGE